MRDIEEGGVELREVGKQSASVLPSEAEAMMLNNNYEGKEKGIVY